MHPPDLPPGVDPDDVIGLGGDPVTCAPCEREGRGSVPAAHVAYDWDLGGYVLLGSSGLRVDVLSRSLREQVALSCPACGRALGVYSLGGLVKRQRDRRPLSIG